MPEARDRRHAHAARQRRARPPPAPVPHTTMRPGSIPSSSARFTIHCRVAMQSSSPAGKGFSGRAGSSATPRPHLVPEPRRPAGSVSSSAVPAGAAAAVKQRARRARGTAPSVQRQRPRAIDRLVTDSMPMPRPPRARGTELDTHHRSNDLQVDCIHRDRHGKHLGVRDSGAAPTSPSAVRHGDGSRRRPSPQRRALALPHARRM